MTTSTTDVDLRASQQDGTFKAIIPFVLLPLIALICRFIARGIQKPKFEFDDYNGLAALSFTLECSTLSMKMTHLGSGEHLAAVPLGNIPQYSKEIDHPAASYPPAFQPSAPFFPVSLPQTAVTQGQTQDGQATRTKSEADTRI